MKLRRNCGESSGNLNFNSFMHFPLGTSNAFNVTPRYRLVHGHVCILGPRPGEAVLIYGLAVHLDLLSGHP